MKNKNFSSVCYAVAAVLFCICAAMEYFSGNSSMGAIHLCLGATFLALMASENNKNKNKNKDNDNNDNNGGKPAEEDKKDEENK